jgi:DNA polymerase III alpha subunit
MRNSGATAFSVKAFLTLAMSGAFDGISQNATRKALTDAAETLFDAGGKTRDDADLFRMNTPSKEKTYLDYVNLNAPKMTPEEIIDMEMESTDLFLTKHPIETYWEELPRFKSDSIADTISKSDAYAVFIGYVHRIRP